ITYMGNIGLRIEFFAIEGDLAAIGKKDTGDHAYQGGFTGSVRSQQTKDAAGRQGKADIVYGFLGGVVFFQVVYFEYVHGKVKLDVCALSANLTSLRGVI